MLAVFGVLLFITQFIPVLGGITMFFVPFPFMLYSARNNLKYTGLFFVAALFVGFIIGTVTSLPLVIMFGLPGLAIGLAIKNKQSRFVTFMAGSLLFLFSLIGMYGVFVKFFQIDFIGQMTQTLEESVDMSVKLLESLGQPADERFVKQWRESTKMMTVLIPSMFVIFSFAFVFLLQLINFPILKRFGISISKAKPFRELSLPKSVLLYYFLAMIVSMFFHPAEGTYWFAVITNLLFILQILMVVQGLSFLFYIVYQKGYPKALAIIGVALTLMFPIILYIIRILGIIDLGFDLRKRLGSNNQK